MTKENKKPLSENIKFGSHQGFNREFMLVEDIKEAVEKAREYLYKNHCLQSEAAGDEEIKKAVDEFIDKIFGRFE
jgi:hypothetical protein